MDKKEEIEKEYGKQLKWERLDDSRASRIYTSIPFNINDPVADFDFGKRWVVENFIRFIEIFQHRIRDLSEL